MKIALMVIYIKYNDLNIIIKGMGFESIIDLLNENLTLKYEIRRTEFVGPTVGEELKRNGFWAVVVALFGILLYISDKTKTLKKLHPNNVKTHNNTKT